MSQVMFRKSSVPSPSLTSFSKTSVIPSQNYGLNLPGKPFESRALLGGEGYVVLNLISVMVIRRLIDLFIYLLLSMLTRGMVLRIFKFSFIQFIV